MPLRLTSWMRSQSSGLMSRKLDRLGHARIVDEDVDLAEIVAMTASTALMQACLSVTSQARPRCGSPPAGFEAARSSFRRRTVDVENGDPGAFGRKAAGGGKANAPR